MSAADDRINGIMKRKTQAWKDARFHLQPWPTFLLLGAAKGDIDVQRLAREEMANRGPGLAGEWVGFETARVLWEIES